jgi:hypothetical protein
MAFVSWSAKQQSTVALSTLDAEYIQQSEGAREAFWLRGFFGELSMLQEEPTPLRVDNAGAMALAQRKAFYDRSKHLDVKCHYTREMVATGVVALLRVDSADNVADVFTKPLGRIKFQKFLAYLLDPGSCQ